MTLLQPLASRRARSSVDFKVNNFDLLRIFAATQVVFIHSVTHLDLTKPVGWSLVDAFPGVPIFFVISGFLISASYERSKAIVGYARNRLLRILPGLWTVLAVTAVVVAAFGYPVASPKGVVWLAAQMVGLIFTPGFLGDFGFGSYNGALWTIPIEMQFYVVLPFFYLLTRNRPEIRNKVFIAAFVVFAIGAFAYATSVTPIAGPGAEESAALKLLRYSFAPHFFMFLAGVLLQRYQAYRSSWIAGRAGWWLAGYLAVYYAVPDGNATHYVVTSLLLAVTIISVAYSGTSLGHNAFGGHDISYGVYIFHGLVLNVLIETGRSGSWTLVPVVLAGTFVLATASWLLVEQRFLRRKRTTIHPTAATAPAHAA